MRRTIWAGLLPVLLLACSSPKGDPKITIDELKDKLSFLASDSLKGRYPGTAEDKVCAEYIASEFKGAGLYAFEDSYLKPFQIITNNSLGSDNYLSFQGRRFDLKKDFMPFPFSANSLSNAKLVFAGYGFDLKNDSLEWNDYATVDVKDKWVLLLRANPKPDETKSVYVNQSPDRNKVMLAADKGAKGVLFVNPYSLRAKDKLTDLKDRSGNTSIPVIHITREVADLILSEQEKTLKDLEEELNKSKSGKSFEIQGMVKGKTEIVQETQDTYNIVGFMQGNDPVLQDEYIVVGGHYDHLGFGGSNTGSRKPDTTAIHYGADDNASGIAALMEIARNLYEKRYQLKRSVIVVAFGAEEKGLLGSKEFVKNAPVELKQIKAMINVDMLGRMKNDKLEIGGIGTSVKGRVLMDSLLGESNMKAVFSSEGYGPSDHASFYAKDIPVFFISTGGHMDYHTPADTYDKLNYEGLKSASELIAGLCENLMTRTENLQFQEAGPKVSVRRGFKGKVILGFMPDFSYLGDEGLRADFVTPGRPGHQGGLMAGDVIVSLDGHNIGNVHDYMYRLGKLKAGQVITLEVKRGDELKVLIIQL